MAEKFRSNMDPRLLRARERICEITGIARGSLPFVADLIHIDPAFAQWQPAAERVMGGFARMLLVPDEFYPQVAAAVDATHLGTKLTYQDIDAMLESLRPQAISARSLAATIVVEHGRYEGWIQHQLSTRFDHVRSESIEEFRSHRRAVTKAGQLRDGSRHVKDDRSRIDDRSRWVLFENSDARIDVLLSLIHI